MSGIDLSVAAHRQLPTPRAGSTSSGTGTGCSCRCVVQARESISSSGY
jgi:hypothetical protein